ncbi:hypothetical protein GLV98_01855 [Halobacillus litoralis]|uniref:Uncharacterized protein n=1 Tax=Halobacillus litoralis TaxID=45668 RepID=A0A845DY62_9BACI|nr:hypothetical protein [Halobacillus litoralis]MYL48204.1 hypothetical protein [Halobacillus litoralis]
MWKFLFWLLGIGLVFGGGYIVGIITSDDPSYQISIQEEGGEGQPPNGAVLSDVDHPAKLDSLLGILLHKQPAEGVSVNINEPDAFLKLMSPQRSIGLTAHRIWFTDDGAVLAEERNGTWQDAVFFTISERDASYIQSIMEGEAE